MPFNLIGAVNSKWKKNLETIRNQFSGLCLAYHESRFDSSAIGKTNPDGSKDLGIFQISEKWWCKWDRVSIVSCDVKCEKVVRFH